MSDFDDRESSWNAMKSRLPLFETIAAVVAVCAVAFLTALPATQTSSGQANVELNDSLSAAITSISSRPMAPPSPAWGFSPATAMHGMSIPKSV